MHAFLELLAGNQLLLLFTVIGLGYLLGSVRLFGFGLGVSAVLFVGIALGAIDPRLALPDTIYVIGLVLFVYAIGLHAGPGFFASFHKRGLGTGVAAVLVLAGGAVVAGLLGRLLGLSAASTAGLFCGALTNTPALAATVETIKNLAPGLPADQVQLLLSSPVVTYGLAYPFGVFGVILWFFVFGRVRKVDFAQEERDRLEAASAEAILSRTFLVTNPAVVGQTTEQALATFGNAGFALSRIKKGESIEIVAQDTVLAAGDQIVAVGNAAAMERARILFGEESPQHIAERRDETSYSNLFVSNKKVVGKTIREVRLLPGFEGSITRLRRGDVEFVPTPDTVLQMGDRILVVSRRADAGRATSLFGDSVRAISETDFLSLSLGIVLGVFLGMVPFPLPRGMTFRLGFAGGPLMTGLVLGRLGRTGRVHWTLPFNANLVLRQIGLVFFLAGIGTKAGFGFGDTFQRGGWGLIAAGAVITTAVSVTALWVGTRTLKLPMSAVMGMVSGIQTQPACLAYANQQTKNELPNLWYATVYPASMIAKIILAQILVSTLLMQR